MNSAMQEQTQSGLRRRPAAARSSALSSTQSTAPRLLSVGCAVPGLSRAQAEVASELANLWQLEGAQRDRWRRIIAGTGINQRHGVLPLEQIVHHSTSARMRLYEQHAPTVAEEAARRALAGSNIDPSSVTDLIVVSCTGFAAPGLDAALIRRLGLSHSGRRCTIGFMGCFGAISGLRAAVGACSVDRNAVALVVCCELCSLHVPPKPNVNDLVAAALFGDGAAAAVVVGEGSFKQALEAADEAALGRLTVGHSRILPEGRDWMTWRVTDAGFAMTIDKAVPNALREALPPFVNNAIPQQPRTFAIHPGGPGILEAANDALRLEGACGLEASWHVLQRVGNVSSATILFVLDELNRSALLEPPVLLLAFGPGLTVESISLLRD